MEKNLVLSAAVGYKFEQIEFFIKSLRKFYKEEVCIVIDAKNTELEKKLKDYNCNTINTQIGKNETINRRNEIFTNYLKDKNYKNILLCDSRDIYFQGNPFKYDYKGPIKNTVEEMLGGLRSALTYAGARCIKDLPKCTTFVRVNRQLNEIYS